MKILYVDLRYDYGIKSRGRNHIGQDGFKHSMEQLGHAVTPFYYDEYLKNTAQLQIDLLAFTDNVKPDMVFFCLFKDQFDHETLKCLKSKYITVNWFGDDQWRFDEFTKNYANDFTWCITTDLYSLSKYNEIGQSNVVLSQWAAIDALREKINLDSKSNTDYDYDVSFVGGYHPYRAWFINQLKKSGIDVEVFGNGWPNGSLSAEEMSSVFARSKINLNISNSSSLDVRYLFSSHKSIISAIRSKKNNSQVKARNFEIPFFGGFELTDYVPSLEGYFEIGKEIACYASPEDATRQIKFYLNNDELRQMICNAGHKRAISEHGYLHRLEKVLEQIK